MAGDPNKVLATRNIAARISVWAAANALPANTVAWNGTWGGTFTDAGYTMGGLHLTAEVTRTPVRVDQELDSVFMVATDRTATMATQIAQFDLANIPIGTGQGAVATTAATTAVRGQDEYTLGSTVTDTFYTIGFDIKGLDGEPIRMAGWRGLPTGGFELNFVADGTEVTTPLSFQLTPDSSVSPARILTIRDVIPIA